MIQHAVKKAVEGIDLTREEARAAMETIMNGEATDAQIGGFLVAMRLKGETVEEIASFARVMREKATRIDAGNADVLDTCGTGGDGARTFNIQPRRRSSRRERGSRWPSTATGRCLRHAEAPMCSPPSG